VGFCSVCLAGMRLFGSLGGWVCSSALLLALGTYLSTVKVLVWVGNEYEPMHVFLPLGFLLCVLSLLILACGILLGRRETVAGRLKTVVSRASVIVGLILGLLSLASVLFPWVIAGRVEPLVETRAGALDVGRYHGLTGVDLLMGINRVDEVSLLFAGAIIGVLHIPLLALVEKERRDAARPFLFLLAGICILAPVSLVYARGGWWIMMRVDGALGFSARLERLGVGLLVAASCAAALIVFATLTAVKLVLQRKPR